MLFQTQHTSFEINNMYIKKLINNTRKKRKVPIHVFYFLFLLLLCIIQKSSVAQFRIIYYLFNNKKEKHTDANDFPNQLSKLTKFNSNDYFP